MNYLNSQYKTNENKEEAKVNNIRVIQKKMLIHIECRNEILL